MKRCFTGMVVASLGLGALSRPAAPAAEAPAPPASAAPGSDAAHSITLPNLAPELPPGPNREAVAGACVICHSTRYILIQPMFPAKTWAAEVDKMRKTYGAPVSDEQAAQVVKYLVSIRGLPEPATQP